MKLVDEKGNICKEASQKYIKETVKDPNWETIAEKAFLKCIDEAPKYATPYQKLTGISIETCNFIFDTMGDCVDIASFSVCF